MVQEKLERELYAVRLGTTKAHWGPLRGPTRDHS